MRRRLVILTLGLLTAAGIVLRGQHLAGVEGTLREDEARLVLAADGINRTGLPTLPSGRLYFRGAVNSYLTAASRAAFGRRDFAARLPNVVVGSLLVPLLFLFGRALGGNVAGLCVAAFGAVQPELVRWAGSAWMTSLFVVVFVGGAYLLSLGYERDQPRFQIAGGIVVALAPLTHELGVLLACAVLTMIFWRFIRHDTHWYRGAPTAFSLAGIVGGILLFVGLGLALRAGTVAGATGEFSHYYGPSIKLDRLLVDWERWRPNYLPLVGAVILGLPMLLRRAEAGSRLLCVTTAAAAFTVWFAIAKTSERYGLVLLPLLGLLAVSAICQWSAWIARKRELTLAGSNRLRTALLIIIFAIAIRGDVQAAFVGLKTVPRAETWLTEFRSLNAGSGDLVFSDNPEIPAVYLGRADFWERARNFERYAYRAGDGLRHIYTGAWRIGGADDLFRVARANQDKMLWYFGDGDGFEDFAPEVRSQILGAATLTRRAADGTVIVRINLSALARSSSAESRR